VVCSKSENQRRRKNQKGYRFDLLVLPQPSRPVHPWRHLATVPRLLVHFRPLTGCSDAAEFVPTEPATQLRRGHGVVDGGETKTGRADGEAAGI
jgi:hypothetical protein